MVETEHIFYAHKIILSADSPVFKNILQKNQHVHPFIFVKGPILQLEGIHIST